MNQDLPVVEEHLKVPLVSPISCSKFLCVAPFLDTAYTFYTLAQLRFLSCWNETDD